MKTIQKYLSEAQKANALLDRAYLFLEDGDTKNALAYFDRVLDENAREPFAYLGKLLVAMRVKEIGEIALYERSYTENADFVKALRFSEGELHEALEKVARERDAYAEAYEKACDAEKVATDIEAFIEVYKLFELAGDFADAKAKVKAIKEALSLLAYYSGAGYGKILEVVEGARARQTTLNAMIQQLNTLIQSEATMQTTMNGEVAKRQRELDNLGWFKKKRKLELAAEIEEGKKALTALEESIKKNKRQLAQANGELRRVGEKLALEEVFGVRSSQSGSVGKGEGTDIPELAGLELIDFASDDEARALLARKGVMGVVAKNTLSLFAMLQDEKVIELITSSEENTSAVGTSPAFRKVAPYVFASIRTCKNLQRFLPVALRVALEAVAGDIVTLGYFPEDGRDPYSGIVPMPGTPYVRPGNPVEWKILKRENGMLTLIPTKPLTQKAFDYTCRKEMTWANCTLREYMQGAMFDLLFQGEEAEMVVPMKVTVGNLSVTDKILLPSHAEVMEVYPLLEKNEHYIWTRDKIEIDYYNSSWLVQPSVFSMKFASQWKELVFHECDLLPVVTIKVPKV